MGTSNDNNYLYVHFLSAVVINVTNTITQIYNVMYCSVSSVADFPRMCCHLSRFECTCHDVGFENKTI